MAVNEIHETCLASIGICGHDFMQEENMRNLVDSKLWWVTFSFSVTQWYKLEKIIESLAWNLPLCCFCYLAMVGQIMLSVSQLCELDHPKMVWAWLNHPAISIVVLIYCAVLAGGGIYCLRRNAVGYGLYQARRVFVEHRRTVQLIWL